MNGLNVLVVQGGIFGAQSNSTALTQRILESLEARHGELQVVRRDLAAEPLPYFDAQVATALAKTPEQRDNAENAIADLSGQLISEVQQADVIVLGVPMYNFGIPAQMKSWFDLIARAGVTFSYGETGPQGLLADRPVYVVAARGGLHQGKASDSQTEFLKTVLGFVGLKSVSLIYAEGLNMGEAAKQQGLADFSKQVEQVIAR